MPKKSSQPEMPRIFTIRKFKVVLDSELAKLYEVQVRLLNQAVRRNQNRFPKEFCFQLTSQEEADLKSQIASSSDGEEPRLRSQTVILKGEAEDRFSPGKSLNSRAKPA